MQHCLGVRIRLWHQCASPSASRGCWLPLGLHHNGVIQVRVRPAEGRQVLPGPRNASQGCKQAWGILEPVTAGNWQGLMGAEPSSGCCISYHLPLKQWGLPQASPAPCLSASPLPFLCRLCFLPCLPAPSPLCGATCCKLTTPTPGQCCSPLSHGPGGQCLVHHQLDAACES